MEKAQISWLAYLQVFALWLSVRPGAAQFCASLGMLSALPSWMNEWKLRVMLHFCTGLGSCHWQRVCGLDRVVMGSVDRGLRSMVG